MESALLDERNIRLDDPLCRIVVTPEPGAYSIGSRTGTVYFLIFLKAFLQSLRLALRESEPLEDVDLFEQDKVDFAMFWPLMPLRVLREQLEDAADASSIETAKLDHKSFAVIGAW